jgi:hypothetical protein
VKLASVVGAGAAVLALAACDRGPSATAPITSPVRLTIVSGSGQSAPVNTLLPQTIRVRVLNSSGQPVPNFVVDFVVTSGGGSVFGGAEVTNSSGYADELWTLGPRLGAQMLAARSVNSSTGAPETYGSFTATATPPANVNVVGSNATGIFMMNADGSGFKQLTTGGSDMLPDLSPDHTKIVFWRKGALYITSPSGSNAHQIAAPACGVNYATPQFSPDGTEILYQGLVQDGTAPCSVGSEPLTAVIDSLGNQIGGFAEPGIDEAGISWAIDGRSFVFSTTEFVDGLDLFREGPAPHPGDFAFIACCGTQLTNGWVINLTAAAPDGEHLAFVGAPTGQQTSYLSIMNTDGTSIKQLTSAVGLGGTLSWSPDGTLIAIDHGFTNADGTGYTLVKGCPCRFPSR